MISNFFLLVTWLSASCCVDINDQKALELLASPAAAVFEKHDYNNLGAGLSLDSCNYVIQGSEMVSAPFKPASAIDEGKQTAIIPHDSSVNLDLGLRPSWHQITHLSGVEGGVPATNIFSKGKMMQEPHDPYSLARYMINERLKLGQSSRKGSRWDERQEKDTSNHRDEELRESRAYEQLPTDMPKYQFYPLTMSNVAFWQNTNLFEKERAVGGERLKKIASDDGKEKDRVFIDLTQEGDHEMQQSEESSTSNVVKTTLPSQSEAIRKLALARMPTTKPMNLAKNGSKEPTTSIIRYHNLHATSEEGDSNQTLDFSSKKRKMIQEPYQQNSSLRYRVDERIQIDRSSRKEEEKSRLDKSQEKSSHGNKGKEKILIDPAQKWAHRMQQSERSSKSDLVRTEVPFESEGIRKLPLEIATKLTTFTEEKSNKPKPVVIHPYQFNDMAGWLESSIGSPMDSLRTWSNYSFLEVIGIEIIAKRKLIHGEDQICFNLPEFISSRECMRRHTFKSIVTYIHTLNKFSHPPLFDTEEKLQKTLQETVFHLTAFWDRLNNSKKDRLNTSKDHRLTKLNDDKVIMLEDTSNDQGGSSNFPTEADSKSPFLFASRIEEAKFEELLNREGLLLNREGFRVDDKNKITRFLFMMWLRSNASATYKTVEWKRETLSVIHKLVLTLKSSEHVLSQVSNAAKRPRTLLSAEKLLTYKVLEPFSIRWSEYGEFGV